MKLWEIKAQALRLMFADTDIEFSFDEFENNSIYENANTREKLVRMNDSIRRAIDLYYHYHGEEILTMNSPLLVVEKNEETGEYIQYFLETPLIDVLRIDLLRKDNIGGDNFILNEFMQNVSFIRQGDKCVLEKFVVEPERFVLRIWYKQKRYSIPEMVEELTFDILDAQIPEEIQRKIPFYIKGELYEEDEADVAQSAKNEYISFVITFKRNKPVQKQTKVRSRFQW